MRSKDAKIASSSGLRPESFLICQGEDNSDSNWPDRIVSICLPMGHTSERLREVALLNSFNVADI